MAANTTAALFPEHMFPREHPFYYSTGASVFPFMSDHVMAVLAPIAAYWIVAAFFQVLDSSDAEWLARRRIHTSVEVASRNLVSRAVVLRAVIVQQVIQMILAWVWMSTDVRVVNAPLEMSILAESMRSILVRLAGRSTADALLKTAGPKLVYNMYWWIVPTAQFFFAMVILDTWQYFLHRAMHVNKTLYKHFHSVHHRLYVPYAFGALYNHPVEGFLLDSLGSVLAEGAAQLSVRQATFFFVVATAKTIDDHCGYNFSWDPLQMFSGNNADYHDIHHQVIGIKSNFSQPFFVHWDVLLGTRMTRQEIQDRRAKAKAKTT